jgi:hypothetical protein
MKGLLSQASGLANRLTTSVSLNMHSRDLFAVSAAQAII